MTIVWKGFILLIKNKYIVLCYLYNVISLCYFYAHNPLLSAPCVQSRSDLLYRCFIIKVSRIHFLSLCPMLRCIRVRQARCSHKSSSACLNKVRCVIAAFECGATLQPESLVEMKFKGTLLWVRGNVQLKHLSFICAANTSFG